jgi:hypothetical protein
MVFHVFSCLLRKETLVFVQCVIRNIHHSGTIGYSSTPIIIDAKNPPLHFCPPFDYNQHGDTIVVTESAMGSMSGSPKYKNYKAIPYVTRTQLPNNDETICEIKKFLNPQ